MRIRLLLMLGLYLIIPRIVTEAFAEDQITVHEITMAAPDIIRVEVREPPIRSGQILSLLAPSQESNGSWVKANDGEWGVIVGPRGDHIRVSDYANMKPLDRDLIDQVGGYGVIGNRKVTSVFRKSVPWSSGFFSPDGKNRKSLTSFRHFIYLKLSYSLTNGTYNITWPRNILPPTTFVFEDRLTRSSSIRSTQVGHSPSDVSKYAYLALWLPNGPQNGAFDFREYNINSFHIIDEHNETVFTGSIDLRMGPTEVEVRDGIPGELNVYKRIDGSTYEGNRAGTFVFGLDYSAWQNPIAGTFRIFIDGLGTSDPFEVDKQVWRRAARVSMAGLYHQRSGLALDGRFGYARPECFTESSDVTVYQSILPLALSDQGRGFVKFQEGAQLPWITNEVVPDAWGGYHDAGDWDRRIQHVRASYLLLDVFEQISGEGRQERFNTPSSEEVLQHPLYYGRDLPDLVDEAIWNLDFYRRLQRSDGAVRGGIDSASHPRFWEPCWFESQVVFAYSPDPNASYSYAAGAAKLAIVLESISEFALADLYRESAIKAWGWAERALVDPEIAFGASRALLDLPAEEYEEKISRVLRRARDARLWAAGTLFRLTGQDRFNDAVKNRISEGRVAGLWAGDGAWEYANTKHPAADPSLQDRMRKRIVGTASMHIVEVQQNNVAYKSMKHGLAPMSWGEGMAPNGNEASLLIRAHRITGEDRFLATMLDGSAHILGANQVGMSFTTGIGHRWPFAPLHQDSIAAGTEAPIGITIYGWAQQRLTNYWWIWGPKWGALSDQVPERRVEPFRLSLPIYEYLIEYRGIIMSMEYTVQQTIGSTAAVWIYLHDIFGDPGVYENKPNNEIVPVIEPIDDTAPSVSIINPLDGDSVQAGATIELEIQASDNNALKLVEVKINGSQTYTFVGDGPYKISWEVDTAAGSQNQIRAQAKDVSGNVSSTEVVVVTVDNQEPATGPQTLEISGIRVEQVSNTEARVYFSINPPAIGQTEFGTTESLGTVYAPEAEYISQHVQTLRNLRESATYFFKVSGSTAEGAYTESNIMSFTTGSSQPVPDLVDTTRPTVKIIEPGSIVYVKDVAIVLEANDNVGVQGVDLYINGNRETTFSGSGTHQYNWKITRRLIGQEIEILVVATDLSGNEASDMLKVKRVIPRRNRTNTNEKTGAR